MAVATGTRKRVSAGWRAARGQLKAVSLRNLLNLGSVVGAFLLLGSSTPGLQMLGVLAAVVTLGTLVWRRRTDFLRPARGSLLGYFVSVRAILFVALGAGYQLRRPDQHGWIWGAVAVGVFLALSEPLVKALLDVPKQVVVNLPGVRSVPAAPFVPGWLATTSVLLLLLGAGLAALAAPGWILLLLALVTAPVTVLAALFAVRANVVSSRAEARIPAALKNLKPQFAVYYAAVTGARYQLGMWLPYLERLDVPFIVITRHPETVSTIRQLTSAPILVPKKDRVSESLDAMVVGSLKAAYYVQGSPANQTFQRYRQLTHIWLNHGDSDKPATFHPRHATYDKLFVPGRQGMERYANHGIEVAPERFVLVGRPQTENIETRNAPLAAGGPRTVLYAPTWKGGRPSTNYSSLPMGRDIVVELLERGCTVVFRPHPVSYADRQDAKRIRHIQLLLEADRTASGGRRTHVFGDQAEQDWDLPACFNASDALITDVSSVAGDYLASGKPFAMVAVLVGDQPFTEEFPTAQAAYVIEKDLSTLPDVLDHLLGQDTLAAERLTYRDFCLGPNVGAHAADDFLRVSRDILAGSGTANQSGDGAPLKPSTAAGQG